MAISLRDYAAQKGYTVGYKDGKVSITNPNTGYSTGFAAGQGSPYGVGVYTGGTHYLSDASKLDGIMSSTSLRDYAAQNGYNVGYSNGYVSLNNPTTGYTTGFQSGSGSSLGVGGMSGGSNYVTDPTKLQSIMNQQSKTQPILNNPSITTSPNSYTPKYLDNTSTQTTLNNLGSSQFNYPSLTNENIQSQLGNIQNQQFNYPSLTNENIQGQLSNMQNQQFDYPELTNSMVQDELNKLNTQFQYGNLTNEDVMKSLNSLSRQFNYNPNQDTALQAAQRQAQDAVKKYMARNGMLYSDSAKTRMLSESQNLIPQFEERSYGRFKDELGREKDILGMRLQERDSAYDRFSGDRQHGLGVLEQKVNMRDSEYDKFRDNRQFGMDVLGKQMDVRESEYDKFRDSQQLGLDVLGKQMDARESEYNKYQDNIQNQYNLLSQKAQLEQLNYTEYKDLQQLELQQYGAVLSPEARRQMTIFNTIPNDLKRDLETTFGGDYNAEINRLRATDPNHYMIPYLEAMRLNKILKDPNSLSKHGSQYGITAPSLASNSVEYDTNRYQRDIAQVESQWASQIKSAEYQKIKVDIESGNLQNAQAKILNSYLPQEMKLKLLQMSADLAATKASTTNTYADTAYTNKSTALMK